MRRFQYQSQSAPIETITSTAQEIEKWAPFYDTPKPRKPWVRAVFVSGHADASWFLTPPAALASPSFLVQNPEPVRRKRAFHPSLYPAQNPYIFKSVGIIQPISIASTATVGTPALIPVSASQLLIGSGGSWTQYAWKESTFHIEKTLTAEWSAEFSLDHFEGDTLPTPGQEVAMFWQGTKRWGGIIRKVDQIGQQGASSQSPKWMVLNIECGGYSSFLDRVLAAIFFTLPMGAASGIIAYELWRIYLQTNFGTTKDLTTVPNYATGEVLFHYVTMREAFRRLADVSPGWDIWIDDNNELQFADTSPATGTLAAPFNIRDGAWADDAASINPDSMTVESSNERFRNRQYVLPRANLLSLREETTAATAGQSTFETQYVQNTAALVTVDGVAEACTELGTWTGAPWFFVPGGIGLFRTPGAPALAAGAVVVIAYPNPFPLAFVAENAASIAAIGLYESIYQTKNIIDGASCQSLADGLLEMFGTDGDFPKRITFSYNSNRQSAWVTPGMIIDINHTFPNFTGDATIEQVISDEQELNLWRHTVTCRVNLGEVTDEATLEDVILSGARVPIISPPERATFELDIDDVGQATGLWTNRYTVRIPPGLVSFGIASWDWWFPSNPPTGASYIVDILLNGTSIFATGNANKINVPAGSTSVQTGIQFVTNNIRVYDGDVLSINVIQVGSTNPGGYSLGHLNFVA